MKRLLFALALMGAVQSNAREITDVYDFTMRLSVPRVYDNMESLGYRKYQSQNIKGELLITYEEDVGTEKKFPKVEVRNLVNYTHKINGYRITYDCIVGGDDSGPTTRVDLIGDNKKDVFKTASIVFYLDAEPDYSKGGDDEDNSLLVTIAGKGTTSDFTERMYDGTKRKYRLIKRFSGNVSGTLGCGCRAYGHKSPTRIAGAYGPTGFTDDVASVFGSWSATFNKKKSDRSK